MNREDLRDLIDSLTADIEFQYNGSWGAISPITRTHIDLGYAGSEMTVHSLDEAMNLKFIDGKSLNEVVEDVEVWD